MRLIDADALKYRDVKVTTNEIDIFGFGDYIVEERKGILQEEIWNAPTIDAVPHWIPCEERLPEDSDYHDFWETPDGAVLWCKAAGEIGVGWYYESTKNWSDLWDNVVKDVTAWMPLPEPDTKRKDNG